MRASLRTCHRHDYVGPYVADLARSSTWKRSAPPACASASTRWAARALALLAAGRSTRYRIAATVVSDTVDPTFRFMTADWDGRIRMDCSSPYAMTRLIGMQGVFDVAFANDTDADRHGIVDRAAG